jgi:AcrR family transcriptional regulator
MPYPTQITPDRILERAEALLEQHGAEQMSLYQLAAALGVKTPSLYRYYAGKADLLRAMNLRTVERLIAAMKHAAEHASGSDAERVLQMGLTYRLFALEQPNAYALAFGAREPATRPDPASLEVLAQEIQAVISPISGDAGSLTALRGLWALVHGYVMIELAGQFQRGGDLDAAYESSLRIYIRGLTA